MGIRISLAVFVVALGSVALATPPALDSSAVEAAADWGAGLADAEAIGARATAGMQIAAGSELAGERSASEAPVPWPPAPLAELPERDAARAAVDRAWRLPAGSVDDRVARTQRAALALGLRDLDGAARAALMDPELGDAIDRAEYAAALSPGLPAAHAALADAYLRSGDPRRGAKALEAAVRAISSHLEARAWTMATGGDFAVAVGIAWAVVFLLLGAIASLPALVHRLGATRLALAGPPALVAIVSLVLALALLEGPAGAFLGLGAVAIASGGAGRRIGVCIVCACAVLALHSGFERAAEGRLLLAADPVATAVRRVEAGLATPSELGLVLRASATDWDAARAAAIAAKRAGDPRAADAYFAHVLEARPSADAHNNAANVAFALRDLPRAIESYEASTRRTPSALAYFNLAQAYGRAVRLDDQDRALTQAQLLDLGAVEQLTGTAASGNPFVIDIGFSTEAVLERARATGAAARLAAASRERLAPGWLGDQLELALGLVAVVLAAGLALGVGLERAVGPRDFYADLARTLRGGAGDSAQRVAELTRMRARRARNERLLTLLALLVPGAAGFRFRRPLAALFASLACAGAFGLWATATSAPIDPFAMGALPRLALQAGAAACALVYLLATTAAFLLRIEE